MLPHVPNEQYSAVLDEIAAEMLRAGRITAPPVDALELAGAMGIVVAVDGRQTGRARVARLHDWNRGAAQPSILLRPEPRCERRHWAILHELGEMAAGDVFARLGIDPAEASPMARETVANDLAGRLLLPRDWFAPDARRLDWNVYRLKQRYTTASYEMIARRMLDLEVSVIITIFDQQRLTLRRSNLACRVPPPAACELECWRRAHRLGENCCETAGGLRGQAWAVHEPGWKRELLRTELLDAG